VWCDSNTWPREVAGAVGRVAMKWLPNDVIAFQFPIEVLTTATYCMRMKCSGLILTANNFIYYPDTEIHNKMTNSSVCVGFPLCNHLHHLARGISVFQFHYHDLRNTQKGKPREEGREPIIWLLMARIWSVFDNRSHSHRQHMYSYPCV
jgi:hypothetical protein